jgi:hypothetical protein
MERRARAGKLSRWLAIVLVVFVLAVIAIGAFGTYMASEAGMLPWQEDPTRIPITPFADLPGISTLVPERTPAS